MSTLSSDQLADLQVDLGISSDGSVFTDAELNRLFTRAEADYDRTVVYALDQIMVDAAKLNDYTAGASEEKKSQVFTALEKMRGIWARRAGVGLGTVRAGVIDMDFMEKGD
jgi:hypothetical protein